MGLILVVFLAEESENVVRGFVAIHDWHVDVHKDESIVLVFASCVGTFLFIPLFEFLDRNLPIVGHVYLQLTVIMRIIFSRIFRHWDPKILNHHFQGHHVEFDVVYD